MSSTKEGRATYSRKACWIDSSIQFSDRDRMTTHQQTTHPALHRQSAGMMVSNALGEYLTQTQQELAKCNPSM